MSKGLYWDRTREPLMDTDPHQPLPSIGQSASTARQGDKAGKASAIIGSEAFVERVLRAMTLGAREALEENAALESPPPKP